MNLLPLFSLLLITSISDDQPSAVEQTNIAITKHEAMAKKVTALVRDTSKALEKYAAVKAILPDVRIALAEQARTKLSTHFVDAVALRSESRVRMMKASKYIEAARFATTVEEANVLLAKANEEALKSQGLTLRATDAEADARAWLTNFLNAIDTRNLSID